MKKFMFYTSDGFTQDIDEKSIDNCQILGWGEGENPFIAYENFQKEFDCLSAFNYENITAAEVLNETIIK